jgi:hypothetical protein
MLARDALSDPALVAAMQEICERYGYGDAGINDVRGIANDILAKFDLNRDELIKALKQVNWYPGPGPFARL